MSEHPITFRPGKIEDAAILAQLVNYAGEGMPLYLWEKIAEGDQTGWDIGKERAAREEGGFSYRNATIIEQEDKPAACLIGYEIGDTPKAITPDMLDMFVPLQELENLACSTWYVNVLAVLPEYRNRGLGSHLLTKADKLGANLGKSGMSVIVADNNTKAKQLYERFNYTEIARRSMVKDDWVSEGKEWVLLTKSF